MKRIDRDIFEDMDQEEARQLSRLLPEADKKEKDRIFRMSRKLYEAKTAGDSVTGVEVISRKKSFRRWAGLAACMALIAGIGGAAFAMRPQPSQELSEAPEISAEPVTEEEPATEPEQSAEEPAEEVYVPQLQLHEAAPYAETLEEAEALMQEHSHLIPWNQRRGIDTDYYAGLLMSEDYDLNCLEAKSYIYHILLNSQLYYSTAKGSLVITFDTYESSDSEAAYTDFQVDMDAQETFEDVTFSRGGSLQYYAYDDKIIHTLAGMQYQSSFHNKDRYFNYIEDNYCHIDIAPPDNGLTGHSGSNAFMYDSQALLVPSQYATGMLMDFDSWQVTGHGNEIGRDCVYISGTWRDADFTMTVDVNTGILLSIYSSTDPLIDIRMTSLEVDVPLERVEFDPTGYTEVDLHSLQ